MSDRSADSLRTALLDAIAEAYRAGRGVPPSLEAITRAYARSQREAEVAIEHVIIDVKELVRAHAAPEDLVFVPRLVGWTVAGYFAGSSGPSSR